MVGGKLAVVAGFIIPAGILVFPITYIAADVLTEVYGYRQARRVIWLGFFCNVLAVVVIWGAQILPPAPVWDGQEAYERILGQSPRLVLASFVAYLVGELANSFVLAAMKVMTRGRWLWTRTIGSTVIGQALDSVVFVLLAFWGTSGVQVLLGIAGAQWLAKCAYEVLLTPATYAAVNFLKEREGLDVYNSPLGSEPRTQGGS